MEVGVIIPNAGPKTSPENIVATARLAADLGYHSLWLTDHVVLPEQVNAYYPYRSHGRWDYPSDTNWLDPLLSLAWAGAAAPGLKLGTSVLVLPIRNPVLLAKQVASLDCLSGGRVILGVGAGWMEEEFEIIGERFENRGSRAAEMVELMRRYWSGESVVFEGKHYHTAAARMYPRPAQGSIPIVWGGHTDAALRRVARLGDGWHPTQISLDQLATGLQKLGAYCERFGRDPASLSVIARPGDNYEINDRTHARHVELGVDHLIVDTPIKEVDPDLSILRAQMERVAKICGLG
ncbi:MAG: hypothetical protein ETSY1_11585 [Candidatus Entotheonella factor]|uniref:Luciferase-like domain-containing protein n=2 Tax=Candidatus Entotheonella TaxID=93171 RepID=W4LQU8_ENTF1|nr:MAG: hypothetical protein ETSY1_11585 [Candidatus Entotheonella factor]